MSRCAVCKRRVPQGFFMCGFDWSNVPLSLQREVNRAWRGLENNPGAGLDSPQWKHYERARAAAIASASCNQLSL